jgi:hypothetical protein
MMDHLHLSPHQVEALVAYLPHFEAPDFSAGAWHRGPHAIPVYNYSPSVQHFLQTLDQLDIIQPFDWGAWAHKACDLIEGKGIDEADQVTLHKLLIAHIRADRFIEGQLASAFQAGHITAILRRLRDLQEVQTSLPIS